MLQEKVAFGIGIGTVAEIDALNILGATKLAMRGQWRAAGATRLFTDRCPDTAGA